MAKPEGVVKYIADYSIDLIGPGAARARRQVEACKASLRSDPHQSEPELGFGEEFRLPFIPCLDRWAARREALVALFARGHWVFPIFAPTTAAAAEVFKHSWWEPTEPTEQVSGQSGRSPSWKWGRTAPAGCLEVRLGGR